VQLYREGLSPEKRAKTNAAWKAEQRRRRLDDPVWVEKQRQHDRNRHTMRHYGISLAERDAMLAAQDGRCGLTHCRKAIAFGGKLGAHIDHCHDTGRVRGVLCQQCNTSLGKLGDSIDSIRSVLEYLERGSK
jgi:hypothetical protein